MDKYKMESVDRKDLSFSIIHHEDQTVDNIEYPYSKVIKLITDRETANRKQYPNKLILCEGNEIDILLY